MRFCLISEASVPEETVRLLREACAARAIPFETIVARSFEFDPAQRLRPGDLLYRAAVSTAASRVEQFVFTPGVATIYRSDEGVFFQAGTQPLLAQSAGIAMPRTVCLASGAPGLLARQAERVGGFPVVVKVLGRSGGIGVMRADSLPALRSTVDYVLAQGANPLLCEYIGDAMHWRVIVLGAEAIAAYRNPRAANDFRSVGSTQPEDFTERPADALASLAVRAAALFHLEFAGVDVLEDPSGNVFFLEANSPFYYPHAQLYGGVDIAGRLVDFLAGRSARPQ
jgi:hypothetical protein